MIKKPLTAAICAALLSTAGAAPVLQQLSPDALSYGYGTDFLVSPQSGVNDVTALLYAVDLVSPVFAPNTSTSGCEASDFAGYAVGAIALIQRGTCTFDLKVANAKAAGALGVLLFNEGGAGRTDAIVALLAGDETTLPVFFSTWAVGESLRDGINQGLTGSTVRMAVTREDLLAIPEPGSLALAGWALAALAAGGARRRRAG